jgi:hypothetical protein
LNEELECTKQILCVAYNNLGSSLLLSKNLEKSKEYLEKAIKINIEIYGSEHINVARVLQNLSSLLI